MYSYNAIRQLHTLQDLLEADVHDRTVLERQYCDIIEYFLDRREIRSVSAELEWFTEYLLKKRVPPSQYTVGE